MSYCYICLDHQRCTFNNQSDWRYAMLSGRVISHCLPGACMAKHCHMCSAQLPQMSAGDMGGHVRSCRSGACEKHRGQQSFARENSGLVWQRTCAGVRQSGVQHLQLSRNSKLQHKFKSAFQLQTNYSLSAGVSSLACTSWYCMLTRLPR